MDKFWSTQHSNENTFLYANFWFLVRQLVTILELTILRQASDIWRPQLHKWVGRDVNNRIFYVIQKHFVTYSLYNFSKEIEQ